uniref:Uncharacterized protein n=1 Tax=Candidatus Methanogaster sp. ANME-2c ERB4 TaxID=2759911 RepID=A0A7G9YLX5_9EURY|nr:hypothetical protein CMADCPIN_00039 [Methanosarcinales archaeon ANME-2c ERB4]
MAVVTTHHAVVVLIPAGLVLRSDLVAASAALLTFHQFFWLIGSCWHRKKCSPREAVLPVHILGVLRSMALTARLVCRHLYLINGISRVVC